MVGLNCKDETVASVKEACVRTFKYNGPLFGVDGAVELVEVKASVVVTGKYSYTKQVPLFYGNIKANGTGFASRAAKRCSKKAICIWMLAGLVAIGGYVVTHMAHVKDYAGDMPYILNIYS